MSNLPEIVYYYCKPATFESIIRKRKLWLCDMMKTNDYREIDYVLDEIIKTANKAFFSSIMASEDADLVEKTVKNRIQFYKKCHYWLAICFSTQKDDLGQWRAYGGDGLGFAIGFDVKELQAFTSHPCFQFAAIKYGENSKNGFVQKATASLLEELVACVNRNSIRAKTGLNLKGHGIINQWGDQLTSKVCFHKSEAFSRKKEYRLCYTRTLLDKDWPTLLDPDTNKGSMLHNLATTFKNNELHLHLEKEFPASAIKEIVIGPNCRISSREMQLLLAINKFDPEKIAITPSEVTYRR